MHFEGPRILLSPKATQTVALVAHELATNTCKYGALSVVTGRVFVTWRTVGDAASLALQLEWREVGGPPSKPPTRRGFGTTLISLVAGAEFGCDPKLIYADRGFQYTIEAPLARIGTLLIDTPIRRNLKNPIVRSLYECWVRQRGSDGGLPKLAGFDWTRFAATGALSIAKISPEGAVQFVQIGRALTERLGSSAAEIRQSQEGDLQRRAKSYLQCAHKAEPCHEFMRFDFGDDDPVTFECLLVPFSSSLDHTPTHVVGIVVFEGRTDSPENKI